jgi:hypothetical protein
MSPTTNKKKLFIFAAQHLRDVVRTRDPPLGFKRGQAVDLKDTMARLIVLQWLTRKFEGSLLTCLLNDINPIATRRLFNEFLDGEKTPENTLALCVQIAMASGHDTTASEWTMTSMLLDEAWEIQNSPSTG